MSKLISKPLQCGFRKPVLKLSVLPISARCEHKDGPTVCNITDNFPTNCPLQDGMSYDEHLKRVLELGKDTAKLLYKSKRRTRIHCINHVVGRSPDGMCNLQGSDSRYYLDCQGVNCGKFQTKTK